MNVISGLIPDAVSVNGVPYRHGIVIPWEGPVNAWGADGFDALTAADFAQLAEWMPELVIFGSGQRLRFPPAPLLRPLIEKRIGLETMDTAAACRTYNVLVGEGRRAVLALLLGSSS